MVTFARPWSNYVNSLDCWAGQISLQVIGSNKWSASNIKSSPFYLKIQLNRLYFNYLTERLIHFNGTLMILSVLLSKMSNMLNILFLMIFVKLMPFSSLLLFFFFLFSIEIKNQRHLYCYLLHWNKFLQMGQLIYSAKSVYYVPPSPKMVILMSKVSDLWVSLYTLGKNTAQK